VGPQQRTTHQEVDLWQQTVFHLVELRKEEGIVLKNLAVVVVEAILGAVVVVTVVVDVAVVPLPPPVLELEGVDDDIVASMHGDYMGAFVSRRYHVQGYTERAIASRNLSHQTWLFIILRQSRMDLALD
jgi:DNA-binding Lrp family transcriptional regulator